VWTKNFVKASSTQLKKALGEIGIAVPFHSLLMGGRARIATHKIIFDIIGNWITADFHPRHRFLDFRQVDSPDTGENLASIVYTVLAELDIGAKLLQLLGTMPTIIQQWQKFLGVNNFCIPTVGIISTDISMASMDSMNMNTYEYKIFFMDNIGISADLYPCSRKATDMNTMNMPNFHGSRILTMGNSINWTIQDLLNSSYKKLNYRAPWPTR
jgi:hypothetical protein